MTDDHDGAPAGDQSPAAGARRRSQASARLGRGRASGAPRAPIRLAASRRMMQQIAAARKLRRQRAALAMVGVMSALTLLVSGSAWVVTSYVSASLGRVSAGTSGTPSSGPVNILVAGIDTRGGMTRRQEVRLHVGNTISANSDTLMLVHIPADHASAQVVSLPRDSWVNIPGHGMNKINAAYGLGGPRLMVAHRRAGHRQRRQRLRRGPLRSASSRSSTRSAASTSACRTRLMIPTAACTCRPECTMWTA